MDNLETLFQKGEYELVIKLTELSSEPKELLIRISSLVALTKYDEALDNIEKYQSVIENVYLLRLMKLHFELLLMKKLFDEARLALSHYETLPYVSQEVEEYLREIKERIESESHPKNTKNYSFEEINETLENGANQGDVSNVLFSLKNYNINIYIDSLKKFLVRKDIHANLRTYGLLVLVDNKIDENIDVIVDDSLISINPSKIEPPFVGQRFSKVIQLVSSKCDSNVTLTSTALNLLNYYIIDTYPKDIYVDGEETLAEAVVHIAKGYLKIDDSVKEEIASLANKIKTTIESVPDIKL